MASKKYNSINIVADVHGRFDELQKLLDKLPSAEITVFLGDLVDRGPKSKEVLDYVMTAKDTICLYGNHEDLMVGHFENRSDWWFPNGGTQTFNSFNYFVPEHYLAWMKKLPLYFQTNDLFLSHAPVENLRYTKDLNLDGVPGWVPRNRFERDTKAVEDFIWNRDSPTKKESKFMVYGHNHRPKSLLDENSVEFARCIDNTGHKKLCAMNWPSRELFYEDYI